MKKILFVAGITVIGLSAAFAQDVKQAQTPAAATQQSGRAGITRSNPEEMAKVRTSRLNKELTLTDDQQKKVYELFLKESQENQGRSLQRQEIDDQLKAILTPEQNQKYETMKTNRQNMMMKKTGRAASGKTQAAPADK